MRPLRSLFETRDGENRALDGLRAVAILYVILFHYVDQAQPEIASWIKVPLLEGRSGVSLFFILSGYLISSILAAEYKRSQRIDFKKFFIRRFIRIAPAYYAFVIFSWMLLKAAEVVALKSGNSEGVATAGILLDGYFWNFVYLTNYLYNAELHLWSLSVEAHFYLAFPFFVRFLYFPASPRGRWLWLAVLCLLPSLLRFTIDQSAPSAMSLNNSTHFRISDLMLGVAVMEFQQQYPEAFHRLTSGLQGIVVTLLGLVAIAIAANSTSFVPALDYTGRGLLFNFGYLLLLALCANRDSKASAFFSLLCFRPIARMSYTLYLWHQTLFAMGLAIVVRLSGASASGLGAAFFGGLLMVVIAVIPYTLFEWSFLQLRARSRWGAKEQRSA